MDRVFYSPSRRGFFHGQVHGDRVPEDAVEISADRHAELMAAQSGGQTIQPGPAGAPIAADPPAPPSDALWARLRRRRDILLIRSDWSQLGDVPAPMSKAWRAYRQALRDLPAATQDPASPVWPTPPALA